MWLYPERGPAIFVNKLELDKIMHLIYDLPCAIRNIEELATSKHHLKTHFLKTAYDL